MTLNLIRRLVKGEPLTATDHDGNLDKLENGIEARPTTAEQSAAIAAAVAAHVAAADPHEGYLTPAEGDAAYVGLGDARLSDTREWTADTISQAEAEAGTATTRRAFTAQRVRQAIAAWWTGVSTAAGRAMVEALDAAAQRTLLGLGIADSPSFTGLTITGTAPVVIPHIHGSIAGDFYIHVKNTSGGPLAAGTAVCAVGSVGSTDRIEVIACDPTDPTKMPAIGLLQTTLANNDDGDAVVLGELRPFNTGGYQIRDRLYVGAGGAPVATPPASGLLQYVGSVARVNAQTGTILVGIGAAMARVGFTGAYGDLSEPPALGTAAALDVGTTAGTVAAGDDARLSDARTPTAHKSSHATGGADALTPGDIGAATSAQGSLADSAVQPGDLATVATTGAYGDLSDPPTIPTPADAAPQPLGATAAIGDSTDYARENHVHQRDSDVIVIPVGDEGTDLTTGTAKISFRMPFAATLLAVRASVNTAPTGSTLIVDINEGGTSVLGTKLSIDAGELTSTTAASAPTITDSSLADDALITIDIDQIGSTVAGAGLKVSLFVRRS